VEIKIRCDTKPPLIRIRHADDLSYFDNLSPVTGTKVCQIARSSAADIELALDAAHKAKDAWGKSDRLLRGVEILAVLPTSKSNC
jgi:aldehyde dehydrogenase